jgi:hypothetical protein
VKEEEGIIRINKRGGDSVRVEEGRNCCFPSVELKKARKVVSSSIRIFIENSGGPLYLI